MANTDSPFGAVAVGTSDGSDYHGKAQRVEFLAADGVACFIGDFVKRTGTGGTDGKTPVVAQAAATDALVGVLVSLEPDFTDEGSLTSNHRTASTARFGKVLMGSDVLYTVQEDSVGGALTTAEVGENVDIAVAAGSTITGISAMELDSSSQVSTTAQLRLRRVDGVLGNALGTNAKWVVNINENQDDHGAGI